MAGNQDKMLKSQKISLIFFCGRSGPTSPTSPESPRLADLKRVKNREYGARRIAKVQTGHIPSPRAQMRKLLARLRLATDRNASCIRVHIRDRQLNGLTSLEYSRQIRPFVPRIR